MIKFISNSFAFIDELEYFSQIYSSENQNFNWIKPRSIFYEINNQFLMDSKVKSNVNKKKSSKKRKLNLAPEFLVKNCSIVTAAHKNFLNEVIFVSASSKSKNENNCDTISNCNNFLAKKAVKNASYLKTCIFYKKPSSLEKFIIKNNNQEIALFDPILYINNNDQIILVKNSNNLEEYILPPNCQFITADVQFVKHFVYCDLKFDLIIMDPPWPNKTVKRQKSYYLFNKVDDITSLPISNLLTDDGLLCIWLSNNENIHLKIKQIIDKNWGLVELTLWHWLKVCKINGDPVVDFRPEHKVPFESIVFICHKDHENKYSKLKELKNFVLISTPNANPSRKPPLQKILEHLNIIKSKNALELFARYLLPNTTSVGYEVLKFQNVYYFK